MVWRSSFKGYLYRTIGGLIIFLSILGLSLYMSEAAPVTLIQDGKPKATIVIGNPDRLVTHLAVSELNHYLKRMTGTMLPIADDTKRRAGTLVFIGESNATSALGLTNSSFAPQEYILETHPNLLVIMGRDSMKVGKFDYEKEGIWEGFSFFEDLGTLYAVYDFLERCCGVRWYFPTKIGEVVPKKKTLVIEDIRIRRKPWAKYRFLWPYQFMPEKLYQWDFSDADSLKVLNPLPKREVFLFWIRQKMGGEFFTCSHSFGPWQKRFAKNHPEFFALKKDGCVNYNQLNYSQPEVITQVLQDIKECMEGRWNDEQGIPRFGNAGRTIIPLVPMDNSEWSYDPQSRLLILSEPTRSIGTFENNSTSAYIFQFVTQVAQEILKQNSAARISALAYHDYYFPPEGIAFPSNISLMVCKHQIMAGTNQFDQVYYDSLQEWHTKVKSLYVWEYLNVSSKVHNNIFPGILPKRIGDDVTRLRKLGISGEFMEFDNNEDLSSLLSWMLNPVMQHLNYYFALKLLDTTERPIDELLEEYYHVFYGPAKVPMKKFFERMEEIYMLGTSYPSWRLNELQSWTLYCPPERIKELGALIVEAKRKVKGDPFLGGRIDLIDRAVFQYLKASSQRYHKTHMNQKKYGL